MIAQVSAGTEASTMASQEKRAHLLRGLFDSYYADYAQPVIFDTNRPGRHSCPLRLRCSPTPR